MDHNISDRIIHKDEFENGRVKFYQGVVAQRYEGPSMFAYELHTFPEGFDTERYWERGAGVYDIIPFSEDVWHALELHMASAENLREQAATAEGDAIDEFEKVLGESS